MHVDDAITSRRSVRRFLPTPVEREVVEHILRVASRAPSGSNIQPWKVHVLTGTVLERLSTALIAAADSSPDTEQPEYTYYPREWFEPYLSRRRACGFGLYDKLGIARGDKPARHRQMLRNFLFFDAPVGLIVTIDRRLETGSYMDAAMLVQNILVSARGQGLHTCAQAAFAGYHGVVRQHLPMTDDEILLCGISLGYEDPNAAENHFVTERVPLSEFTTFSGY